MKSTQRERVPGCAPGLSDQQQATTHTATGNGSPISPYRVTWLRRGWTEPRERGCGSEDAARALFGGLLRDQPNLVDLKLEWWAGEVWGGWATWLALYDGTVYDSATPEGGRRISQAAYRRDDQSRDTVADEVTRQRWSALTVAIHWSGVAPGGGGAS